ncbi:MAG: hypothetical protein HUJ31_06950 [Pseudomonadales bacterium]|nr:hypothetical protein [Pseudomonadales bacterium]
MSGDIKDSVMSMLDDLADDFESDDSFESEAVVARHDIRRKIEDMLERKRLREEFGDLEEFDI